MAEVDYEREIAILKLAIPIEEELSDRIDEALKYLAMGDGFTLNGLARLFVDVQRRIAADWLEIGQLRRSSAQLQTAQTLLQQLEWAGQDQGQTACPCCKAWSELGNGHAAWCELAKFLTTTREA